MPKQSRNLTALEVGRLSAPGKYPLGSCLYMQITESGSKSWIFRYSMNKKAHWMGLGSCKLLSLAEARSRVIDFQREMLNGVDPLAKKRAEAISALKTVDLTFSDCANRYIEAHKQGWKNAKHAEQWLSTLSTYAFPLLGPMPVRVIDTHLVLQVLEPIWYKVPETASRVRGRMERVLSWATVRGYRDGANPALWRGHLDQLLPKRNALQKVSHFKALPFAEIPVFMEALRKAEGTAARALEFLILTATRTSETMLARWEEIDMASQCWTIPANRMKAKKEHRVPLSPRAIEILQGMGGGGAHFVFPGARPGKPLSNSAFLATLDRMGYEVTAHGFRSTFSDWAGETTQYPRDLVEMALAHTIKNKVEAAYRRGDGFMKRARLMEDWATFTSSRDCRRGELVLMPQSAQAATL